MGLDADVLARRAGELLEAVEDASVAREGRDSEELDRAARGLAVVAERGLVAALVLGVGMVGERIVEESEDRLDLLADGEGSAGVVRGAVGQERTERVVIPDPREERGDDGRDEDEREPTREEDDEPDTASLQGSPHAARV